MALRLITMIAGGFAALVLSACGDMYNTRAPAEDDEAAKRFDAVPGDAVIYVYRAESPVAAIQAFRVFLDTSSPASSLFSKNEESWEHVADFTPGRFIRLVTSPGSHEIAVRTIRDASNNDFLALTTESGGVYYVELEVGAGVVSGSPSLTLTEASSAQPEIKRAALMVRGTPTR